MKKVCFFTSRIENSGGTEKVSLILANELVKFGYDVYFFNLIGGDVPYFETNKNIKIFSLHLPLNSTKRNFIKILKNLRSHILRNKIDIVVDVDSILTVFSAIALFKIPVKHICWEHFNFNVDLGVSFRRIGRKIAAKCCDHIVTLTKRDIKLWKEGLGKINSEIIAIPNPSSFQGIGCVPSLQFKTVISIGRPAYVKGYDFLFQIWKEVCKVKADWVLKIIGCDDEFEKLLELAKILDIANNVVFIPATKDIEKYYKTSSLYCMCSRFEGFPMVLLEAQAFGLPIVAFNCDTGPAEVIENYRNGILVEQGNIEQFTKAILTIIDDEIMYQNMVEYSKESSSQFNINIFTEKWLNIL